MPEVETVWEPGDAHGLVWDWGAALLPGHLDMARVAPLWTGLSGVDSGAHLGTFLKALSDALEQDLLDLPGFVVVVMTGGGVHVAARGPFAVLVAAGSEIVRIDGSTLSTWSERRWDDAQGVELRSLDGADGPARPIHSGMVPARVIRIGTLLAGRPVVAASVSTEAAEPSGAAPPAEPEAVVVEPEPKVAEEADASTPETGGPAVADPDDDSEPDLIAAGAVPPPPVRHDEPAVAGGLLVGAWNEYSILDLVDQAAVHEVNGDARMAPANGMISNVPKAGADPGPPEIDDRADQLSPINSMIDLDLHDGHTIAQLDGPPADAAAENDAEIVGAGLVPALIADPVRAAFCPEQHPNPTHRTTCRVCGADVGGAQRTIERPSLGRVRGSAGEVLELTGPVVVGRTPRADRFRGVDVPQLVPLPHKHISANHLQIRTEGWSVLAVDLHSRNGTYLRRYGQQPTRLLETPTLLTSGDVLDLGHGVQLTFEELP